MEREVIFDDHTLDLGHTAALNVCSMIEESRKRTEPFSKIVQNSI